MSSPVIQGPPLDTGTWSGYLVSTLINTTLLGVLTVQTYTYYSTNYGRQRDSMFLRAWVGVVVVVGYAHTIIMAWLTYLSLISHFLEAPLKMKMVWMPMALATLEGLSTTLTQLWFARRQYLLMPPGRKWTAIPVAIVSLVTLGSAIAVAVSIRTNIYLVTAHDYCFEYIWLGGNALGDILVTVPVSWHLYRTKSTFGPTNRMVNQITLWVVATGALTSSVAIVVLILYASGTHTLAYVPLARLLSSLYTNSLLAFLNRRPSWAQDSISNHDVAEVHSHYKHRTLSILPQHTGPRRGVFGAKTNRNSTMLSDLSRQTGTQSGGTVFDISAAAARRFGPSIAHPMGNGPYLQSVSNQQESCTLQEFDSSSNDPIGDSKIDQAVKNQ